MKNKKLITIVLVFLLATLGCTSEYRDPKNAMLDEVVVHESEQGKALEQLSAQQQTMKKELQSLLTVAEKMLEEQRSEEAEERDNRAIQWVIEKLRPYALKQEFLTNPENRVLLSESGQALVNRIVILFNEAVLMGYKNNLPLVTQSSLIREYKSLILWDCNEDLRGSCEMIRYYKRIDSSSITAIMKVIYDQESEDHEKLRIIKASYDLKNRSVDQPLRFMFLDRLRQSFELAKSKNVDKKRLQQDAYLFANITKLASFDIPSGSIRESYVALIREMNPLNLSRNHDNPANPALSDLIKIAGSELIYEKEELSDALKKSIQSISTVIGPNYEQGVDFQQENIRGDIKPVIGPLLEAQKEEDEKRIAEETLRLDQKQMDLAKAVKKNKDVLLFGKESRSILNNLLSDVSFEKDEYFYLTHQLFYDHFSIDDGATLWELTKKDQVRFMTAIVNLFKMSIVNNIVYTNTKMNDFYNNNKQTKLIELLRESEKEASKIRKAWSKLINRANKMKSFAKRVVIEDSDEKRKDLDNLSKKIDALKKNIKFLVTYPNMFPLMQVMASKEMKDKIQFFFFEWTIDSELIISQFFSGRLSPLFNFGNDGNALDSTEIIYSYYYALATSIFKTYSTNEVVRFDDKEFFKVVVKKLVNKGETSLDNTLRKFKTFNGEYENMRFFLKKACEEERVKQAVEQEKLKELDENFDWVHSFHGQLEKRIHARQQLEFVALDDSIYEPTNVLSERAGNYLDDLYSDDYADVFHLIRTNKYHEDAAPTIQLARMLIEVYKIFNKENKELDDKEIEKLFSQQFEEFNRLKSEFSQVYLHSVKEMEDCEFLFAQRDKDLRQSLMFREIQYLGALFDALEEKIFTLSKSERENPSDLTLSKLEQIRGEFGSASAHEMFPRNYRDRRGYVKLSVNSLTTYKMDVYARVMSYMHELFPGQYEITPPVNFSIEDVYKETKPKVINFDWAETDRQKARKNFIGAGLKNFALFLEWAREFPETEPMEEKLDNLVARYKTKTSSLGVTEFCNKQRESGGRLHPACIKVTAKDLMTYHKKFLDFVNIDHRDEIIIQYLGKDSKYEDKVYEKLIKKTGQNELYSYYDLLFQRVVTDGEVTSPTETWFKSTLVEYINSVHKRKGSTFIFDYPGEIETVFNATYEGWIKNYIANNIGFLKEVKNQPDPEPFVFRYRLDKEFKVGASDGDSFGPYVSDLILGKYNGYIQGVDYDTSRYFEGEIKKNQSELQSMLE